MKTVILCGGKGTRIGGAQAPAPKPMLQIGNRPILWHIMTGYAAAGHKDFVLCLGHRGDEIKRYFLEFHARAGDIKLQLGRPSAMAYEGEYPEQDWRLTLAETGENTQTGGRIARIRRYVENDELFFLTYGDGVGDIDIKALLEFHRARGKIATVTAAVPPSRFGELELSEDSVKCFAEKPNRSPENARRVSAGFFVIDAKRIWDYVETSEDCIFERAPLRRLVEDGELSAYRHNGFWQPMDTQHEFRQLNALWSQGNAPWKTW